MKKYCIVIFAIFILLLSTTVYANTAYTDKVDIKADINKDGSMTVMETIKWDIDGHFNGVYRDILFESENTLNSATKLIVNSVTVDGKEYNYSKENLNNGDVGGYNLLKANGGLRLKIFRPSEDEKITTVITYTLKDVVVNYNDIAELYWNFIGDSWNGIDDLKITISLPENSNDLKIFAHGPLTGTSKIIDKKTVELTARYLNAGEGVDARLLFDKDLISSTKKVNEDKLEEIMASEAKLAEEANKRREEAKATLFVSIVFLSTAIIIPYIIYKKEKKKAYKPNFDGKYYRELPEDYGPAIMNKVLSPITGASNSNDMLGTLLDLVRRKYVEIETIYKDETRKKVKDYLLKLVNKDLQELNAQEKHFVEKMIFKRSDSITLKELKKDNTINQESAYNSLLKWKEKIEEVAVEKGVINKKTGMGKIRAKMIVPSIILIGMILINAMSMNYGDILGFTYFIITVCIIENIVLAHKLNERKKRTEKGAEHEKMWKAFKTFLLDFSKLDERDHKAIVIWEHYLVYAAGLGVAKQVIKELKIVFPNEFNDANDMFTNYVIFSMISSDNAFDSFTTSFTSAANQAFSAPSSSSGSGGGFSGGFGGGGGRWWSRWLLKTNILKANHFDLLF